MSRLTLLKSSVAICSIFAASQAMAGSFNIPAGDLGAALAAYTKQAGVTIMYAADEMKGINSRGVQGDFSSDEALTKILSGSGFSMQRQGAAFEIIRKRSSAHEIQSLQLAQAAPSGRIEEVLVTARKREEAVENIPISITALNSEDLRSFGVRNFSDLEGVVPGLNMGGGGNGVKKDSSPFIRGVGQRETKVTLDPAVGTYIDGVYIGRAAGAMLDVTDVANVQVLRGPQGTLFGRNATGGAISVTLNKPNNSWEANVSANIGNYGRRDLAGVINIPFIEDMVLGRLFLSSTNSNGFFTNINDNTKWGGDNRVTGIAQLRILPTDNLTVDILGERTRIRETPRPQRCAWVRADGFTTVATNAVNGGFANRIDGLNRYEGLCKRAQNLPMSQFTSDAESNSVMPRGRYWVDTSTAAVTVNWDAGNLGPFNDVNAKSISAWRKTRQIADEDLDAIGGNAYLIRIQPDFDDTMQWSEELQISGKTFNDRLFVSTGVYYFKERTPESLLNLSAGISPTVTIAPNVTYPNGAYRTVMQEAAQERLFTDNWAMAWFGQADFDITSQIQITAGARWTQENRWSRYDKAYINPNSVFDGLISYSGTPFVGGYSQMTMTHATPNIRPITTWSFCTDKKTYTEYTPGYYTLATQQCVPDAFIGDELSTTDVAWTPMASLKYKFHESLLQKLRLDHAMIYATYSQGFHSGGVTAGAVDDDKDGVYRFNNSTVAPFIPCPNATTTCGIYSAPNEPGQGTADPIAFEPEKVINYEVGIKAAALDRRLQANFTAFYMDYTNMQTTSVGSRFGIPVPTIENVGKSVIKGFEAEIVALPTSQWRIFMNGSYTDADIKQWMTKVVPLSLTGTADLTAPVYHYDRSDERLPRVPRWQFFASSEYNFSFPGIGTITPSVGVRFASSIYHGFDRGSWVFTNGGYYYNHNGEMPPTFLPSHSLCTGSFVFPGCNWSGSGDPLIQPTPDKKWLLTSRPTAFLDGRLSWISENGQMEATLWGKNLMNVDDYLVGGISLPDMLGSTGQIYANPRTFGLTFTYHFGE